jgi:hypothetical protein
MQLLKLRYLYRKPTHATVSTVLTVGTLTGLLTALADVVLNPMQVATTNPAAI